MKRTVGSLSLLAAALTSACAAPAPQPPAVGGQTDAHGCLPAAGQSWSHLKQQCVQTFAVADIRLQETRGSATFSVDVILSGDKQQAEVFALDLPRPTVLQAVKGGYASADGRIRLLNDNGQWRLRRP